MQRENDTIHFNTMEQRLTGHEYVEVDDLVMAVAGLRDRAAMIYEAAGLTTPENADHVVRDINEAADLQALARKLEPHIPEEAFEVTDDEISNLLETYDDLA